MKSILSFVVGFVLAVALLSSVALFAKDNPLTALLHPIVIDIHQQAPVTASVLVPGAEGNMITATVPLTVNVALQVSVAGIFSPTVTGQSEPAVSVSVPAPVAPAADELLDAAGIPYSLELPVGIELLNVQSGEVGMGSFQLVGQLRNDTDDSLKYTKIIVSLYDANDQLLNVETGFTQLTEVPAGKTSPFKVLSLMVDATDVHRYEVQVELQ